MSVQMAGPRTVERPVAKPLTSTLFDHFPPKTVDHFGLMNNEGLWNSFNCLDTLVPTVMCPDPLVGQDGNFKTFDTAPWVPAYEFAVYGGVQCSLVGQDRADTESELRRVFEANAHKGVEQSLKAVRFVASESDAPVAWDAPVDLGYYQGSSATASAVVALAVLEGYAAGVYAGLPTIHAPRSVVTLWEAAGLVVWQGEKAFTKNGSKIVAGGGYDIGVDQDTWTWDVYATGEVYIEQSEQIDLTMQTAPGDGSGVGSDENGLPDNTGIALAERMFRVGIDCFVARAGVKIISPPAP